MLFSEPIFLFLFLPLLIVANSLLPLRFQNALLAVASILFYAWDEPAHSFILLGSIVFNFTVGLGVDRASNKRKFLLAVGVAGNLGVLAWFKYAGFFVENYNWAAQVAGFTATDLAAPRLPLGISFFTFQALSYLVDVYRGRTPAQTNLIDLALYIALFPQLIAGPIVRYGEFAWQIAKRRLNNRGFALGTRRFIIGLAKKVLIANTLAVPADSIFNLPASDLTAAIAWLGIICYTLQIYFDFSGYSDMAIGLGRMFGFKLPENFNHPYVATSISEFWRRWHLSLSRWFRDYLYIPLGGNRLSANRTYLNLAVVFLLCGLWHGASWTFVLWGLAHGSLLVLERMGLSRPASLPPAVGWGITMLLVMFTWVLFRSPTFAHAIGYLLALFGLAPGAINYHELTDYLSPSVGITIALAAVLSCPLHRHLRRQLIVFIRSADNRADRWRRLLWTHHGRDAAVICLFAVCCIWIAASTYVPFLYFRF